MTPTPQEIRATCTYHHTGRFYGSIWDRPVVTVYRGPLGTGYEILRANEQFRRDHYNYLDIYVKPETGVKHHFRSED